MYVDTHSHIYANEFSEDIDEVISRSLENGVQRIYMPNIDVSSIDAVNKLSTLYPNVCIPQMGLHPCYVKEDYQDQLDVIKTHLFTGSYSAVGEIGLDFYWDKTFTDQQIDAFRTQIEWSRSLKLPIVIHSRDSLEMSIEIVEELQRGDLTGIFHCYGGTIEQAQKIIDLGFYMGIGGVVTFKNSGLDKIISEIDLKHLVLETDSPYLSPTPHRGKRNESGYIPLIAEKIAEIKGHTLQEIAEITTQSANKVYNYTPL